VSVALLVSSAGLAASLLVGAALDHTQAPSLSWQPTVRLTQPAKELPLSQPPSAQALPKSLSSMVPAYTLSASTTVEALPTSVASDQLTRADSTSLSTVGSLKVTAQRSWNVFKLAFRR
jgi:hypothetical protein